MTEFGRLLRSFRQRCSNPKDPRHKLSQAQLGGLLGEELRTQGSYSGAAVSDWERGMSKIHADHRPVLIGLLKVLHKLGGIKTSSEANELLEAGNYRALNASEKQMIFPEESNGLPYEFPANNSPDHHQNFELPLRKRFSEFNKELQKLWAEAQEGPPPAWPRAIATLLKRFLDYLSRPKLLVGLSWFWVWLLTWGLLAPSLRLPFTSRENARVALEFYVAGTLVTPLLIGMLTNPKQNKYWQELNLASSYVTYLYTYQGAGIGFHLGYFGIFALNLLWYYMH